MRVNAVDEPYGELASSFAGIARTLFSAPTVLATPQQIVDCAFATVDGCDVACISLRAADTVFTLPTLPHAHWRLTSSNTRHARVLASMRSRRSQ